MSSERSPAARPTIANIRSDIDSGATGEKVRYPDPALSFLGPTTRRPERR